MQTLHTERTVYHKLKEKKKEHDINGIMHLMYKIPCGASLRSCKLFQGSAKQADLLGFHMRHQKEEDIAFCQELFAATFKRQMKTLNTTHMPFEISKLAPRELPLHKILD